MITSTTLLSRVEVHSRVSFIYPHKRELKSKGKKEYCILKEVGNLGLTMTDRESLSMAHEGGELI